MLSTQSFHRHQHFTTSSKKKFLASEFLGNHEEMFPNYCTYSVVCNPKPNAIVLPVFKGPNFLSQYLNLEIMLIMLN